MITYDKDYVAAYRAKAVTSLDDFIVGRTYYGRLSPGQFILNELITNRESRKRFGLREKEDSESDKIGWYFDGDGRKWSLSDCNIGAHYNPWLIFADEATANEYFSGLKIGREPDAYDPWDDIDDSWWDDGSEDGEKAT